MISEKEHFNMILVRRTQAQKRKLNKILFLFSSNIVKETHTHRKIFRKFITNRIKITHPYSQHPEG